jgi:hypothetical protein
MIELIWLILEAQAPGFSGSNASASAFASRMTKPRTKTLKNM